MRHLEYRWRKFLAPTFASVVCSDLTPRMVLAWLTALRSEHARGERAEPLSTNTVRGAFFTLSGLCRDAIICGHIANNPCQYLRRTLPRAHPSIATQIRRRRFTLPELHQLLTAQTIPFRRRVEYRFAFYTGPRAGELRALRWSDLHFDAPIPFVLIARSWESNTTKNGAPRVVPLHRDLVPLLRLYQSGYSEAWGVDPGDNILFPRSRRAVQQPRGSCSSSACRTLRRDCTLAGLPPSWTTHAFRHTLATTMRAAGVQIADIAALLGHQTEMQLTQIYASIDLAQLSDAVAKVSLFDGLPKPGTECLTGPQLFRHE